MKVETKRVIDLIYTEEEGNSVFVGSNQECMDFVDSQGDSYFTYQIVPLTKEEIKLYNKING